MANTDTSPIFDLFGQLRIAIGRGNDHLERISRALTRPPVQPVTFTKATNLTTPSVNTVPAVLCLEGPTQGFTWDVANLAISGLTPIATVAGTADVFVRGDDLRGGIATYAQIGVTGWRDHATSLPLVSFYSSRQIHLSAGQRLWVVLSGYTTSTEYVAQAEIDQFEDAAYAQVIAQ